MQALNLPSFNFNIRNQGQSTQIFDSLRRKFVVLTPEEWVRQHFIHFLISEKKYPSGLIALEMQIGVGKLRKRCDAVVYNRSGKPLLIIECKATSVKITQETFNQAARYNMSLNVKYLMITNGMEHFCCRINTEIQSFDFLKEIPAYELIC